jgi:hypothetical protein
MKMSNEIKVGDKVMFNDGCDNTPDPGTVWDVVKVDEKYEPKYTLQRGNQTWGATRQDIYKVQGCFVPGKRYKFRNKEGWAEFKFYTKCESCFVTNDDDVITREIDGTYCPGSDYNDDVLSEEYREPIKYTKEVWVSEDLNENGDLTSLCCYVLGKQLHAPWSLEKTEKCKRGFKITVEEV